MKSHLPAVFGILATGLLATPTGAPAFPTGLLPPAAGVSQLFPSDPRTGIALGGFDPVSYFLAGGPMLGRADHAAPHAGLYWWFAGPANRAAFGRDPESFLPRIGGYDPVAVVAGRAVPGDPRVFLLRDGRLFLFRDAASRAAFARDDRIAAAAETDWPALRRGLVGG